MRRSQLYYALGNAVACLLLLSGEGTMAQSVETIVSQNPVEVGQEITVSLRMQDCRGNFAQPAIPGLRHLWGPMQSQQMNITNGTRSTSLEIKHNYLVEATGNIRIPAFTVKTNKGNFTTKPVVIEVIASANGRGNQSKKPGPQSRNQHTKTGTQDAVLDITLSRSEAYVGQSVIATCKLYSATDQLDVRQVQFPDFAGCWKEKIDLGQPKWERVVENGRQLQVAELGSWVLYPQHSGTNVFEGFELTGYLRTSFFNGRNVRVTAKSRRLEVKPRPPASGQEVIGTFELLRLTSKVELPESGRPTADGGVEVLANQALTFELAFSGKGNLKMVKKPTLDWPSDFEVFDPEVEGPIKTDPTGQSGTQKFRYTVIPRAAGTFMMPDVELVYFNPLRKRMEPLSAKGKRVTVLPDFTTQGGSMSFNAKSDVQTLHQDIRYIELDSGRIVARSSARDMRSLVWWLIFLGPMIYAVCWLDERRKRREQSDSRGTKERKAARSLRAALKRSGDAEAIGQAVELYLMAKLGWDQSGYQRSLAIAAIAENRPELARAWNDFLAELEMARYAPGVVSGSATEWNARAMELMKSMEKPNRQVAGMLGVLIGCGLAISAFSAAGQSPVEIAFLEANLAYADGDFDKAIVGYETVLQTHFFFAAEYNLGNAYYKTEQLAPAILHYERAALINPRNGDLAMNLALAQVRTIDRIEELPTQGFRDFWSKLTAPGFWRYWAWTLVLIWTSGFIVLAIRIRLRELATRRMAGSVGIALLALGLITMPIALTCEEEATIDRFAIVMTPTAEVLNAPSGASESGSSAETATAQPLFLLHEGTKFEVLGSSGDWWEIRLANGNVGWIFAESAELI